MTKVTYTVITNVATYPVKTLHEAIELANINGGTYRVEYTQISGETPTKEYQQWSRNHVKRIAEIFGIR